MPCVFQLHPPLHQQQQQHQQHPHQELSLSTPVHALEPDTNFTSFFDDDIVTCGSTSSSAVWLPIQLGNGILPNGAAINAANKAAAEVPFVQIHTTDLQQQAQPEKSYRNAFRRRTAEIKSEELIKSELAEAAAKERLNATPTPPTRNSSCASVEGKAMVQEVPILFRCPNCPFLSLCEVKSSQHVNNCFGTSAEQQRQCPGCPNIFYSSDALNVHLSMDHQLDDDEIATLLGGTATPAAAAASGHKQPLPKSRIFIKSVDCLREPQQDFLPLLQQDTDSPVTSSNILDLLDEVVQTPGPLPPGGQVAVAPPPCHKPSSQKISIKSVDVLREPALLTFDFQLPNGCQEMPLLAESNLVDVPVPVPVSVMEVEPKPRQPKIYIRNVDILKEPMLLPSSLPGMGFNGSVATTIAMQNGGGVASDVFQADTLLTPTGPLPGFEPSLAPLANMCSEPFPFDSVLSVGGGGGASTLENTRFSALDLDFGVDFDHGMAPLLTEATPPPPPPPQPQPQPSVQSGLSELEQPVQLQHYLPPTPSTTKQKIFIKNVDILKAPQRGTLHLRTVDELNFMTRNEVERLIVPNLEPMPKMEPLMDQQHQHQQQHTHTQPQSQPQPLDPLQLEPPNSQTLSEFQAPLSGSWPSEDSYDLAGDLEGWPWIEEAVQEVIPTETAAASEPQVEALPQCSSSDDFPQLYPSPPEPVQSGGDAVPPLVPVSATDDTAVAAAGTAGPISLPLPPLVPLAAEAGEKPGRIYVANNLLPAAVDPLPGGTSVRGRPYGTKLSAATGGGKRKAAPSISQVAEGGKCQVEGCMFRFKSPATLEYHGRCHNDVLGSPQPMVCPECRSSDFSNWNCLHTHLWRTHQIDMELYCCQLCSFKTPIYSRLVNTHAKIHSEERNYKCEQCGKGFKNTKQLKNHRRLHRTQGLGMGKGPLQDQATADAPPGPPTAILHRCGDCGAAFKQRKTLREHLCKERNEQPQCSLCQRLFSSKSSLKLHQRSHQANKRFQCDTCEYEASDHNAFRRHLATHRDRKRYACPHCDFRAIQSTAFRIHLQKRHPEQELSSIIYKCDLCSFSSINQSLLLVHQAKHEHEAPPPNQQPPLAVPVPEAAPATASTPSQIKVETSLLLAHSSTNVATRQAGGSLADVPQSL
ncbi:uncharacterized protein LOC111068790 [Drosophila obscura]|uniref:uncharacterized protein LOC111068790 n=1 Tax=Drosophila obscura TaxID=7282 RepID=UPI001BB29741|nr:uncharacterized protein LOC111068790 [Drosophila obscura]